MDEKHHHSSGFMNGFVLGAIIGAGAVFLFGTKTGKKVLKIISQEGMEAVSDLKNILEEEMNSEEDNEEMSAPKTSFIHEVPFDPMEHHSHDHSDGFDYEEQRIIPVKHIKRFFRGTPKKN